MNTEQTSKNIFMKTKIITKMKLKLPREPFKDLFKEIDIQNENCFDN